MRYTTQQKHDLHVAASEIAMHLAIFGNARIRTNVHVAKAVLLRYASFIVGGRLRRTATKSIGAGVYEVYLLPPED